MRICLSNITTLPPEISTLPTSTEIPYIEGATARKSYFKRSLHLSRLFLVEDSQTIPNSSAFDSIILLLCSRTQKLEITRRFRFEIFRRIYAHEKRRIRLRRLIYLFSAPYRRTKVCATSTGQQRGGSKREYKNIDLLRLITSVEV